MKVAQLETLFCDAGWRPWIFLKATTDDGAVGWSEITDSHGSPRGLAGIIEDLAPLVVGRDPRAVERIVWDLFRATRQSPGSVIQKAIGGIENALLDLKGKALGVPVYELFGGPMRDDVDVYWSHCGTTRARACARCCVESGAPRRRLELRETEAGELRTVLRLSRAARSAHDLP
jgi:galactonate dehydratase